MKKIAVAFLLVIVAVLCSTVVGCKSTTYDKKENGGNSQTTISATDSAEGGNESGVSAKDETSYSAGEPSSDETDFTPWVK